MKIIKNLLTNNQNRDWTLTDKIASDELIYKMSLRKYYEVNLRENIERVISEYKNLLYSTSINSFKNYDSKITINFKILYNSYYSLFKLFKYHNPTKLTKDLEFFVLYLFNLKDENFSFKLRDEYLNLFSEYIIEIIKLLENKQNSSIISNGVNKISKRSFSTNILGKRQFSSVVSSNNHYPEMLDNNLKKRSLVMKDYLFNIKSELDKI